MRHGASVRSSQVILICQADMASQPCDFATLASSQFTGASGAAQYVPSPRVSVLRGMGTILDGGSGPSCPAKRHSGFHKLWSGA